MKKFIYFILLLLTIGSIAFTMYYASFVSNNTPTVEINLVSNATTTEERIDPNALTTSTGKRISIIETNPISIALSTVTLKPFGFATNTEMIMEKNKLSDYFLVDMDKDGFDELVLITTSAGSGSYGEVTIFTTKDDKELSPITIPPLSEDDMKKDALFEGYMGHDSFGVIDGTLLREFPVYKKSDSNAKPTGGLRRIAYTLTTSSSSMSISYSKVTLGTSTLLEVHTKKKVNESSETSTPSPTSEGLDLQ